MTKDEMVGWHHRLSGHEFEQTLGDSEGHRSINLEGHLLASSSPGFLSVSIPHSQDFSLLPVILPSLAL